MNSSVFFKTALPEFIKFFVFQHIINYTKFDDLNSQVSWILDASLYRLVHEYYHHPVRQPAEKTMFLHLKGAHFNALKKNFSEEKTSWWKLMPSNLFIFKKNFFLTR
jgi:hypothetical protein